MPSLVDWDVFQGPAKVTTYNTQYSKYAGKVVDFSIGGCGEVAIHSINGVFWAINVTHPKTFRLVDLPAGEAVQFTFPSKISFQDTVRLNLYRKFDPTQLDLKVPIGKDYKKEIGSTFTHAFVAGDKETATSVGTSRPRIYPYKRMSAFVEEHGEIILGKYSKDHFGSFIQADKSL